MERAPGGGAFAALAQLARNTVTFTHTAANAGVYLYRVRAFDSVAGVSSAYSNAVEVRIR